MNDNVLLFLQLLIPIGLILLGYITGSILEKKHYTSIRIREKNTVKTPVVTFSFFEPDKVIKKSFLVTGSAVISVDYFKRFLAALRNLFGGRVAAYESLLDRARREAILRMKAKCPAADIIVNLRVETSSISKRSHSRQNAVGCVEVIAYGTAIQYSKEAL
ncbi:YbjQ family protein [Aliikangiella sp. IMCC44359]|uniref:YbjQ family protein n=1 Tax=Aliikangiella sp. IMCC44359 TaxID=3459125 RepID=UPI00403ACEEE